MTVKISKIPENSYLARFHINDREYDRMIVVTVLNEGRTIHLMGWVGTPLTVEEWKRHAEEYFPTATEVVFERLRANGSLQEFTLKL